MQSKFKVDDLVLLYLDKPLPNSTARYYRRRDHLDVEKDEDFVSLMKRRFMQPDASVADDLAIPGKIIGIKFRKDLGHMTVPIYSILQQDPPNEVYYCYEHNLKLDTQLIRKIKIEEICNLSSK